jgi:hypothetical protein
LRASCGRSALYFARIREATIDRLRPAMTTVRITSRAISTSRILR